MTVCGLLRLDGTDARRSTIAAMLSASVDGLPAARAVHLDGPFGVVTAPASPAQSMPGVVVDRDGLVVVVHGEPAASPSASASGFASGIETATGTADGNLAAAVRLAAEFRLRGE
nr:hypothetical protein [Micromonospora sp. DSM 115978]